jgi:tetratricopeptide (TPR) repeat protein
MKRRNRSWQSGTMRCPTSGLPAGMKRRPLLRGGAHEQAAEDVRRFGQGLEHMDHNRRYRIAYLRALAVLAHYRGEIDQATRHLQEAAWLAEEIGLPGERWQILAALGELQRRQNDESKARHAFAQAAELMQTLAQQIEDTQQRMTFLSAAPTRYVLEQAAAHL